MTENTSMITIIFDRMDSIPPQFIATHTHGIALFILYLFVRYYRATQNEDPKTIETAKPRDAKLASISTSKLRASISYSKKSKNADISSTLSTSSPSTQSGGKDFHLDDALSRLENDPSLQTGSILAERRRFLVACKGNTTATTNKLNHYLQWNNQHVETKKDHAIRIIPTRDQDYDLWVESCLTAMKICGEVDNIVLPRIVRRPPNTKNSDFVDRDGFRTFCLRPGLMDLKLAKDSTYTLAVAIYFDRSCKREDFEKITICLDVRAGRGWPNTHVLRLIPFVKSSLQILLPLFPERLHKAVVYPVPSTFLYIWRMMSKCMDPDTAKKVCILEGICKIEAPPPMDPLRVHFGEEELEQLEASRIHSFKI